jgi:hypothetical protein
MCASDWVKLLVDGVEWLWSVQMARWQRDLLPIEVLQVWVQGCKLVGGSVVVLRNVCLAVVGLWSSLELVVLWVEDLMIGSEWACVWVCKAKNNQLGCGLHAACLVWLLKEWPRVHGPQLGLLFMACGVGWGSDERCGTLQLA